MFVIGCGSEQKADLNIGAGLCEWCYGGDQVISCAIKSLNKQASTRMKV